MMEDAHPRHKWRDGDAAKTQDASKKMPGVMRARRSLADHGDRHSPSRGEQLTATGCVLGRMQPIAISKFQYDG
jgi:hypothetical protein